MEHRMAGFEQRMEGFGRDVEAASERLAGEADAVARRIADDPSVRRAGDRAALIWGSILLVVGLWFFADVTLGLDVPVMPWADIWPLGLVVLGVLIVMRGMGRGRG
jgi:hypothetical protein